MPRAQIAIDGPRPGGCMVFALWGSVVRRFRTSPWRSEPGGDVEMISSVCFGCVWSSWLSIRTLFSLTQGQRIASFRLSLQRPQHTCPAYVFLHVPSTPHFGTPPVTINATTLHMCGIFSKGSNMLLASATERGSAPTGGRHSTIFVDPQ